MKRNRLGAFRLLIAVLLISGCATTVITSYWKDKGYHKQPHKILVVAILKNKEYRSSLEDEFVIQLGKKGLDVTTGSKAFPASTPGNKAELQEFLGDHGYDAFLLIRIVALKDLLANAPDTAATLQETYSAGNGPNSSTDAVVKERIAMAEANLYDVATGKLFWTAATQTPINEVNHDLMTDYVMEIIRQMQSNGLVQ